MVGEKADEPMLFSGSRHDVGSSSSGSKQTQENIDQPRQRAQTVSLQRVRS